MTKKTKPADVRAGVAVRIFHKVGGQYVRRTKEELYAQADKVVERRIPTNRRGIEVRAGHEHKLTAARRTDDRACMARS
jgi:hypothetical protein